MKKTLLEISLWGQYYKKDITDRYYFKNNNIIITNDAVNILDKHKEKLYIETWNKHIEKDKEIERLNKELTYISDELYKCQDKLLNKDNIINELILECYNCDMTFGEFKNIWKKAYNKEYNSKDLDKLKELKGNNEKD